MNNMDEDNDFPWEVLVICMVFSCINSYRKNTCNAKMIMS